MSATILAMSFLALMAKEDDEPEYTPVVANHALLESKAYVEEAHKLWPLSDSSVLRRLRDNPKLLFYSRRTRPTAIGWSVCEHTGRVEVKTPTMVDRLAFGGNANSDPAHEFPWLHTAGMDLTTVLSPIKFILLPEPVSIREILLTVHHDQRQLKVADEITPAFNWEYPVGTVSGELLLTKTGDYDVVFEVRLRVKTEHGWKSTVFRPFPTPESLDEAIKKLWPDWESHADLAGMVRHLEKQERGYATTLGYEMRNAAYPERIFRTDSGRYEIRSQTGTFQLQRQFIRDDLPPLQADHSNILLRATSFVDVTGLFWYLDDAGTMATAPSTHYDNNIVPKDYLGGAFTQKDCKSCHDTAGINALTEFYPREWYGQVPGRDGLFSFHPWDPKSIRKWNETDGGGFERRPKLDARLIKANLVKDSSIEAGAGLVNYESLER